MSDWNMKNIDLTQKKLKELFYYNPETGDFTRLIKVNFNVNVGDIAGGVDSLGYVKIKINDTSHYAHRLAFLYMTGSYPNKFMDHINRNTSDNRWCNLRPCNAAENSFNQGFHKNNTSGIKGVHWNKRNKKWFARISYNKKRIFLGSFDCKVDAAKAYNVAAIEHHGEFAYLNEVSS